MEKNWVKALNELNQCGEAFVLITLIGARGSTPRDSGTKMIVTENNSFDTIGGGQLEYKAIASAKRILAEEKIDQHIEHYPLNPAFGQCCGGSITILFERFAASAINIMLFGAGHVGQALTSVLADLPCRVSWVDEREAQFPTIIPTNVKVLHTDKPSSVVVSMPPNSYYIVMTHIHKLDFDICEAVLKRKDFRYLGLIGSKTKWRRFEQHLRKLDVDQTDIDRIRCPIGLSKVSGKYPMEVAVSIAAEVIEIYQQDFPSRATQQGVRWKEVKSLLTETA